MTEIGSLSVRFSVDVSALMHQIDQMKAALNTLATTGQPVQSWGDMMKTYKRMYRRVGWSSHCLKAYPLAPRLLRKCHLRKIARRRQQERRRYYA